MIYAFDIDGTLTEPRQKIDRDFLVLMKRFCIDHRVVLVSGSDFVKMEEQVGSLINNVETIYACSGSAKYERYFVDNGSEADWVGTRKKFEYPKGFIKDLQHIVDASSYDYRFGTHIEERGSMVNLSTIGRDCNIEDRKDYFEWDKKYNERDDICFYIKEKYPELECVKGGEISVDIYPKGWDKSQILEYMDETIHFFGDRIAAGGNDHEIAMKILDQGGTVSSVKSWKDTRKILKSLYPYL